MVMDKTNKMRETLRLMSLNQVSYGMSYMIFQTLFAIISGVIISLFAFGKENIFPEDT
jgi:hypothetical protein